MADYIPRNDEAFNTWQGTFKAYAVANAVALGLSPAQVADLTSKNGTWISAFGQVDIAKNAAKAAVADKDVARLAYEATVRILVGIIQKNPDVTDGQRASLGITIAKDRETIPPPTETPNIFVDFSDRTQHTIHWGTNPTNETRNGKPAGVLSCEIRRKIGDIAPGVDQEDFDFVAIDTDSPYTSYLHGLGGQIIHWTARYLNAKGEHGPWCDAVSANVSTT